MFKSLWNCLSRRAEKWVSQWNETSAVRRRLRYSAVDRFLRQAGERPVAFVLDTLACAVVFTLIGWFFVRYHLPALGRGIVTNTSNLMAYFGTLWTIQATIAALVYPIVIAFVAVLLRRRATATLSLRIYSLDASVVPAGSSSIALVAWMGLQYMVLPFATATWVAAAMVGNAAWFTLNTVLTSRFLSRTVRFLNDDDRLEVFQRFAIHVALPRDMRSRLMGILLQRAQEDNLVPGPTYASNEPGPKVLIFPMAVGSVRLKLKARQSREVVDVRLRLLGWAIWLWARRARTAKPKPSIAGLNRAYPTLQIAFYPGQLIEGEAALCRVDGEGDMSLLVRALIRSSIVLGQPTPKALTYSTSDILEEVATEARELTEQGRHEAALTMLVALADIHAVLIQAGSFVDESGSEDNAALLQDPYGFASRRLHEVWLDAYRELARISVDSLPSSSKPFEHHCYLVNRLTSALKHEHIDIVIRLMNISTYLMFRLGDWWSSKIEEHVTRHDHVHDAELPLPIARLYEDAVQSFIGSWEGLDLWESRDERESTHDSWAHQARRGRFAAAHLEHTLGMLLGAVARGDRAAALWLADSLLKWWNSRRHHFGEVEITNFEAADANASSFSRDWSTVRSSMAGIPEDDETVRAVDVVATALYRYWSDMRLVGALLLLSWAPDDPTDNAIWMRVAISLLTGRSTKDGDDDAAGALDARSLILQLLRMQLADDSYTAMFDRVVTNASELLRPRMISGRIYGASGSDDMQSLLSAQALLLAGTINPRTPLPGIEELESAWSRDLRKSERAERLIRQLGNALDEDGYRRKRCVAEALRSSIQSQGILDAAEGRIKRGALRLAGRIVSTRNRIIGAANISQARLDALAREVSNYVLTKTDETFPFVLKPRLRPESIAANRRAVTFKGARKAPYTDPPLEPGASLESSAYREHVALRIASGIVIEYVKSNAVAALRVDSQANFLSDVESAAASLRSQGLKPLLILPRYDTPDCARPWRYFRQEPASAAPVRRRAAEDEPGIVAFFHNVPAYQAPISASCYVSAHEHFRNIGYVSQLEGSCVRATAAPNTDDTIDLTLEWMFGVVTVD